MSDLIIKGEALLDILKKEVKELLSEKGNAEFDCENADFAKLIEGTTLDFEYLCDSEICLIVPKKLEKIKSDRSSDNE